MSQVEFDDQNKSKIYNNELQLNKKSSLFVNILIKIGIAKTSERANAILLIIAIVMIITTSFIVYKINTKNKVSTDDVRRIQEALDRDTKNSLDAYR